jgi:Family of unknown function (DUF6328)
VIDPSEFDVRGEQPAVSRPDDDANRLDDEADREELRTRYYGLLQENRVLVPGVQIMVAFLVAVPFNTRFEEVDSVGRGLWLGALVFGSIAAVMLMAPIVFHRVGERRRRAARLYWAIRMQRCGIVCIAISMCVALAVVVRFAVGSAWATVTLIVLVAVIAGAWVVVPRWTGADGEFRGSARHDA